jgi:molybdopterin-guanine dinucleotide biosynthesis protein B
MRVIGLAGWSGAGKTTLLTRVIPELRKRDVSVSTIKHAHHKFDVDTPGKDSYEHRMAGAHEVLVASENRWALMHELRDEPEWSLNDLIGKLGNVDLVIVEGFKTGTHPRIEVYRQDNGKPPLHGNDRGIVAIASDVAISGASIPVVHLDDAAAIADLMLQYAADAGSLFDHANAGSY